MTYPPPPHKSRGLSRNTVIATVVGVVIVAIGTAALMLRSADDTVDDTAVERSAGPNPTVVTNKAAPTPGEGQDVPTGAASVPEQPAQPDPGRQAVNPAP